MSDEPGKAVGLNVEIKDLVGGGQAVDRLITFLERGIGPVLGPIADRWRNYNQRKDAQAELALIRQAGLVPTAVDLSLNGRATLRIQAQQQREQDNREAIAVEALSELKQIADAGHGFAETAPEPEAEWLDHFWDLAGRISSEGRQRIWGRVLARSAISQAVSARTLSILATMSGDEASQLERMKSFAVRHVSALPSYGVLVSVEGGQLYGPGENHNDLLDIHIQPLNKNLFGSMGVLVESRWLHEFWIKPVHGEYRMEIAGERYVLTPNGPASKHLSRHDRSGTKFGEGYEISPNGEEIFSLIDAQPDPVWIGLLVDIYADFGWRLERDQDAPA